MTVSFPWFLPPNSTSIKLRLGMHILKHVDMASNSTSGWPTRLCDCGDGMCIPTKYGTRARNPGRYYYKCPKNPPCRKWIGWCDEELKNIMGDNGNEWMLTDLGDNGNERMLTDLGDNGNERMLTERVLAVEDKLKVLMVIGIVICVLQVIQLVRM